MSSGSIRPLRSNAGTKLDTKPELGKWWLYRLFHQVPAIGRYLPDTAILTLSTLRRYLQAYGTVFVKPTVGFGGRGIIKAWKTPTGFAFVKERGAVVRCATVEELLAKIRAKSRSGVTFIVQRAVSLAEVNGRPYDIRLMMMRVQGQWQCVGILAKVAGPTSIITNVARGKGYVLDIDTALRRSLGWNDAQIAAMKKEMIALGLRTCQRFDSYKRYLNLGLDLAVDKNGKLWMIEENTGPAKSLFAKLKDQSMYRRIMQIVANRRAAQSGGGRRAVGHR